MDTIPPVNIFSNFWGGDGGRGGTSPSMEDIVMKSLSVFLMTMK